MITTDATNLIDTLTSKGIVAVIRGDSAEEVLKTVEAVIKGGISAIELTYTVPDATSIINTLNETYQKDEAVIIGAGTVTSEEDATAAISAGAKFIVSPTFSEDVARVCREYSVPYMPGCVTPTEVERAMKSGASIVKLFPGSLVGPKYITALKGPFPDLKIMPTGGVSLENMSEWFASGAVMVGTGSNLTKPAQTGEYQKVTELAQEYVAEFNRIKDF